MLTSILQTLAELLAGGTMLTSTEQIDFSHPAMLNDRATGPLLNLYLYDIRESRQFQHSGRQVERRLSEERSTTALVNWSPSWFDVSMILTASDHTTLGEHHLLSEALSLLLRHRSLREEFLARDLQGHGNLTMTVALEPLVEIGSLWSALTVPLRPALYLTITVPVTPQTVPTALVRERVMRALSTWNNTQDSRTLTKQVAIAGIVKNAITSDVLPDVMVELLGTEKSTKSDREGLFFFENLSLGNYMLRLSCNGYQSQPCTVLVDSPMYSFKEVALNPV
ncbi:DUF4255 domain-containing protein [Pseudanabaenaceae cyanobacterium LEGE 13415]|nr:DUF4255 domain-containing protein [Pseudanabaenaceae cyanobacterium LEGE 13415]